jgi:hypothetical protein
MADREAVTIDADEARYAALEKEVQAWGDESEEVKQPDPAPTEAANGAEPGKPVDEAKKQQEPQKQERSYEELERNYKNVQGALTESRSEFREMKRQFEAMQEFIRANMASKKEPEPPLTPEEELHKFLTGLHEGNKRTQAELEALRAEREHSEQMQALGRRAMADEQAFHKQNADYYDAANFLAQNRLSELSMMFPDDSPYAQDAARKAGFRSVSDYRQSTLINEQIGIAGQAYAYGRNPAELIYGFAKARGFSARPTASAAEPKAMQPIDAVKAGREASMSLSSGAGGGKAPDDVSINDLADMFLEDPEQAERMWAKMQRKGLLG